jgi:hypothetical protein
VCGGVFVVVVNRRVPRADILTVSIERVTPSSTSDHAQTRVNIDVKAIRTRGCSHTLLGDWISEGGLCAVDRLDTGTSAVVSVVTLRTVLNAKIGEIVSKSPLGNGTQIHTFSGGKVPKGAKRASSVALSGDTLCELSLIAYQKAVSCRVAAKIRRNCGTG